MAVIQSSVLPAIVAHDLSRCFGRHSAVREYSLQLHRGDVLGLLGPNGAGKSTTMRMLTGNLAPSSGSVRLCGVDLVAYSLEAKRHIGYLPEMPPLYRELTVDEYLRFAARLHGADGVALQAALDEVKQRCELTAVGKRLIGVLSKGFQQRVALAQAIIHRPEVIVMDEPTAGLDPNQILRVRALIRELGQSHAIIFSTHVLSEVEAVCSHVQIMHHGRLVLNAELDVLKRQGENLETLFEQLTMGDGPMREATR